MFVNDDASGIPPLPIPHGKLWVIGKDGIRSDQYRIFLAAPAVYQLTRFRAGNPVLGTVRRCHEAIGCLRPLKYNIWTLLAYACNKPTVEPSRLFGQYTFYNLNSRRPENDYALPVYPVKRVATRHHHPSNPMFGQHVCARRCLAIMRAWL